ncbi:MAG: phosphate ABC transporter substrate-binding protein PstS [Betaproteobacteria bacterium RIFCSPLOWO2_02_FULL_62_17]|nr:MAG: phosphate ABC transporter substrate-binding protein PstS [Betaproteobacteria bacterium RIFCSPLOWO2_02_FULL_62_17]
MGLFTSSKRKLATALTAVLIGAAATAFAADITGAGATFPYPVYAKWAEAYKKATGTGMNYQSIGSGGGIKQIIAKTVDFGASDAPLSVAALEKNGLMQFPAVMGGVVPAVNLEGVKPGQMRLTGEVVADIYLGKIQKWNDRAIAALNPGMTLPDQSITVVHRADGSGTTFIFVHYLAKISPEWSKKVGVAPSVSWPAPNSTGGKGNEGVASFVQRIKGAIGYVEYAYAKQNKMNYTLLRNREGAFVAPDDLTFQSAAAGADWKGTPGFNLMLTDQPGKNSWPISGATFILMHKNQPNADKAKEVLKFFDWAYANGDKLALELDYVPMPDAVVKLIQDAWKVQLRDPSGKAVW